MKAIAVASMLALAAPPAEGQQPRPPAGSPRAVAERVLGALSRKDAPGFARDVHPEAIADFRANVIQVLEQSPTPEQRTQGLQFFGGARSLEEFKRVPADQVFVAYMRRVFEQMNAAGNLRVTNTILGEVPEGPNTAHVLYRARVTAGKDSATNIAVLSLRRSPGGWKALLSGDLQALNGPRPQPPR